MFSKDHAIIAQNSASVAAVLCAAVIEANPNHATTTESACALFDKVRTHIFNGSLALAGAEAVVVGVESAPEPGMDGTPEGVTIDIGLHRGKTVAEVLAMQPGTVNPKIPEQDAETYLRWLTTRSKSAKVAQAIKTVLGPPK